jgi:tRNA G18 (ribose-2'-O)-methylase SpoU
MFKLNAQQLRTTKTDPEKYKKLPKNPIHIVLDDVLDTYNIGSIFRLADAVAAQELIITGRSEIPPNSRIKKASVNTTEWVVWRYQESVIEAIGDLRKRVKGIKVVAIEQSEKSQPLSEMKVETPIAFVVGNETTGISEEVLKAVDEIVEIPMFGVNVSLNVMVSLAIALYKVVGQL